MKTQRQIIKYTGFKTFVEANKKSEDILKENKSYFVGFGYSKEFKHYFEVTQ